MKTHIRLIFILLSSFIVQSSYSQEGFEHRGYLGWLIDMSTTECHEKWPSVKIDSGLIADYEETLAFLHRCGSNEITIWGLFTNDAWEPEVEKTIDGIRTALVRDLIDKAHQRDLKVLCGMGVYSWGFGKIISRNPEIKCDCNPYVMDLSAQGAWDWQKKVIDYVMDDFDFDGISMQSADRGRCNCGTSALYADLEYHAIINQKSVQYIRSKRRNFIIGISGWGMNFGNPDDLPFIKEMTRDVDFLTDVGETALFAGREYRRKLIRSISPCRYGNTAIPNIEPIQAMPRNYYFVPTVSRTCMRLKDIYSDGGRACEAYARTRGNPGDRVTSEVVARLLKDIKLDVKQVLGETLESVYMPENDRALSELIKIYEEAEDAFFNNMPVNDSNDQYKYIILLMPRDRDSVSDEFLKAMSAGSLHKYKRTLNDLYNRTLILEKDLRNKDEAGLLLQCFTNVISEIDRFE